MSAPLTPQQTKEKRADDALKNKGYGFRTWQHTKRNINGKWYTKHWMDELTKYGKWEDYDPYTDKKKQTAALAAEEKKRKEIVAAEDVRESKAQMSQIGRAHV